MSNRIKNLRKSCGLSQQTVAERLGLTRAAYANYEQGIREPSVETIKKICIFFDVSADYLIGLTDSY